MLIQNWSNNEIQMYNCINSFFYKMREIVRTQKLNNYKIINIIIILIAFNLNSCSSLNHNSFSLRIDKELRKVFKPDMPKLAAT